MGLITLLAKWEVINCGGISKFRVRNEVYVRGEFMEINGLKNYDKIAIDANSYNCRDIGDIQIIHMNKKNNKHMGNKGISRK